MPSRANCLAVFKTSPVSLSTMSINPRSCWRSTSMSQRIFICHTLGKKWRLGLSCKTAFCICGISARSAIDPIFFASPFCFAEKARRSHADTLFYELAGLVLDNRGTIGSLLPMPCRASNIFGRYESAGTSAPAFLSAPIWGEMVTRLFDEERREHTHGTVWARSGHA